MKKCLWILIILLSLSISGCSHGEPISSFKIKIGITESDIKNNQQMHEIISTYQTENNNIINILKNNSMTYDEFSQKNEIVLFYRYSDTEKALVFTEVKIYNKERERKATPYEETEFTSVDSDFPSYVGISFTAKANTTPKEAEIYQAIADDFGQFIKTYKQQ